MTEPAYIELRSVSRSFKLNRDTFITAVDNISLSINEGEIVCLVGESGCGKTTTGKILAGLLAPSSGQVLFHGQNIAKMQPKAFHEYRLGVQMVHQDPYASLNPSRTVFQQLQAPLQRHMITSGKARLVRDRAFELLELVDLTPANDFLDLYPHQLSGGQRQRVSIARALTVTPSFIVADEAVSMVDVSIRISLLNTLLRLKEKMGLAVFFITHDLALAKYFAWEGRIGVMYMGRLVEIAPARQLVESPQHPYTQALLSAIPEPDPDATRKKEQIQLRSMDIPSLLHLPAGCAFHPRCHLFAGEICEKVVPPLTPMDNGAAAACHLAAQALQAKKAG